MKIEKEIFKERFLNWYQRMSEKTLEGNEIFDFSFLKWMENEEKLEMKNPYFLYFDIIHLISLNLKNGHDYTDEFMFVLEELVNKMSIIFTKISFDDFLIIVEKENLNSLIKFIEKILEEEDLKGCFIFGQILNGGNIPFNIYDKLAFVAKRHNNKKNIKVEISLN